MEKKSKCITLKKKITIWALIMVMIIPFISTLNEGINNVEHIASSEHQHIHAFTETDGTTLQVGRYDNINLSAGKNNNSIGFAGMYNYFSNYITSIGTGEEELNPLFEFDISTENDIEYAYYGYKKVDGILEPYNEDTIIRIGDSGVLPTVVNDDGFCEFVETPAWRISIFTNTTVNDR